PLEANAELPLRLGQAIELADVELAVVVQMVADGGGRTFADTNDAEVFGAEDDHIEVGVTDFEGQRGEKAGTAAAENEHGLNHRRLRSAATRGGVQAQTA